MVIFDGIFIAVNGGFKNGIFMGQKWWLVIGKMMIWWNIDINGDMFDGKWMGTVSFEISMVNERINGDMRSNIAWMKKNIEKQRWTP